MRFGFNPVDQCFPKLSYNYKFSRTVKKKNLKIEKYRSLSLKSGDYNLIKIMHRTMLN